MTDELHRRIKNSAMQRERNCAVWFCQSDADSAVWPCQTGEIRLSFMKGGGGFAAKKTTDAVKADESLVTDF